MLERFEGSDGLCAIFPAMLNSLIALKALGYADDHPQVLRAERELKQLEHETEDSAAHRAVFLAGVGYAIVSICLHESGLPGNHPALKKACALDYGSGDSFSRRLVPQESCGGGAQRLGVRIQQQVESRTWTTRPWCCSRCVKFPRTITSAATNVLQRGLKWMMTFQCKDGGWAAFDKDCTKSILEKVPFADHNAMLDPECADITARILELLGYEGWDTQHPQVEKALNYVRDQQEDDGSWYGRWGVNYIYGTWQVLRGLRALRVEHESTVVA